MNKDSIITLPNPHLRMRSSKVGFITEETLRHVDDMIAATLDWEASRAHEVGVALAAIQVDIPLRVVVIRNNFDNKTDKDFTTLINPVVVKHEGEVVDDYEGCLSIPEIYGKVPRHQKVKVKALDIHGKEIRLTAEGFQARVLQHEIDHTNGILFIDHIKDNHKAFYHLSATGELEQLNYDKDVKTNSILW